MFRRIVALNGSPADANEVNTAFKNRALDLFNLHPSELAALLEMGWDFRRKDSAQALGHPFRRSDLRDIPANVLDLFENFTSNLGTFAGENTTGQTQWDHLIYAYIVENTRIIDIFRRVVEEFAFGEKLGVPTAEAQGWLRNTEALFFQAPSPFSIFNVTSLVRPDAGAVRSNAYWRMFGMDLNQAGQQPGKPYPKAEAANLQFVRVFHHFCEEVWVGMMNAANQSGANPTDPDGIANDASELFNMFRTRRQNAEFSRVEFYAVAMLSWFHLTLQFDSPIVQSLRAEASSPEQRLFKIAERVGVPAHRYTESFLKMSDALSRIFTQIELGTYNERANVTALFVPGPGGTPNLVESDMRTIITHWSIATGQNLKVRRDQYTPPVPTPPRVAVSANGNGMAHATV